MTLLYFVSFKSENLCFPRKQWTINVRFVDFAVTEASFSRVTTDFERKKKKKNNLQLFRYLKREGRAGQSKKKREEFNLVGFFYIYYEGRRRRLRRHGRRSASRERAAISTLSVATPVRDAVEWQCRAAQPGATQAYLNSRLDYSSDLDNWGDSISYWFGVGD